MREVFIILEHVMVLLCMSIDNIILQVNIRLSCVSVHQIYKKLCHIEIFKWILLKANFYYEFAFLSHRKKQFSTINLNFYHKQKKKWWRKALVLNPFNGLVVCLMRESRVCFAMLSIDIHSCYCRKGTFWMKKQVSVHQIFKTRYHIDIFG